MHDSDGALIGVTQFFNKRMDHEMVEMWSKEWWARSTFIEDDLMVASPSSAMKSAVAVFYQKWATYYTLHKSIMMSSPCYLVTSVHHSGDILCPVILQKQVVFVFLTASLVWPMYYVRNSCTSTPVRNNLAQAVIFSILKIH